MSDNYQAVYDAVRSRFSNCDVGSIVERVAVDALDLGRTRDILQQEFTIAAHEMARPCVLFKPTISIDGTEWCVLLGENIHNGVCGFGRTPAEAMDAFDKEYWKGQTPAARIMEATDVEH